jgi:hypothetical protein
MVREGYRAISVPAEITDDIERIVKAELASTGIARFKTVADFARQALKSYIDTYNLVHPQKAGKAGGKKK